MTETTAFAVSAPTAPGPDPLTAAAAPIRATFTAVMAPYVTGDAPAPADLFAILLEAVSAAEPSADLVAGLCRMISEAEVTPATMAIMHRATGAALGLAIPGVRTPTRIAAAAPSVAATGTSAGASRPGSIGALILQVLAGEPSRAFSVTELANELGRGSGAVGAAVGGILGRGEARLASEFPRRIQALTTGPNPVAAEEPDAADEQALDEDAAPETDEAETGESGADAAQAAPQEPQASMVTGRRKASRA